jgi:hypothetical protein
MSTTYAHPRRRSAVSSTAARPVARRLVVQRLAGGAVGLLAVPLLDACRALARASLADPRAAERASGLDPLVHMMLAHAALAPSGHNAQPWCVRVLGADRLRIDVDAERRLPAVDPHDRELLLSIGAFLENLLVAAGALGRDGAYEVLAARATDARLLDVRFSHAAPTGVPLDRITARRTVRRGQLTRAIDGADVRTMLRAAGEGAAFFPRGSAEARFLDEGTVEANSVQAARDAAQEELARWIRWSDADGRRHRDGLTPASLEMDGLTGWFARHFMHPESVLTPRNRARAVDAAREQVRGGGGWLVMTSPDARPATLLETGRRFERLLLGVRERMLAVHPMSQLLEEAPFAGEVGARLAVRTPVQFLLRVGYLARYPDPVSLRRPVHWFVETPEAVTAP